MRRSNNLLYHELNMARLVDIAELGDQVGLDLWHYETADGRGIELALDFFAPYATGDPWPYFPGTTYPPTYDRYFQLYRRAAVGFGDDNDRSPSRRSSIRSLRRSSSRYQATLRRGWKI